MYAPIINAKDYQPKVDQSGRAVSLSLSHDTTKTGPCQPHYRVQTGRVQGVSLGRWRISHTWDLFVPSPVSNPPPCHFHSPPGSALLSNLQADQRRKRVIPCWLLARRNGAGVALAQLLGGVCLSIFGFAFGGHDLVRGPVSCCFGKAWAGGRGRV